MQPLSEITIHPVDLARHGLNPYGEPLYRVVWADTRKSKVICNSKTHILGRYMHETECAGHWVLEKWAPAEVIIGMTRDQYEAFLKTFPNAAAEDYPEKGEYELSRIFNEDSGPFSKHIDEIALHKQLYFHEWRHEHMTNADRAREVVATEEAKEVVEEKKFDALFEVAREESECH